jgi:hypothetical protein
VKHVPRYSLGALFLLSLAAIAQPAFSRPEVWVAPSLVRVGPTAPAGEASAITLRAAKGEYESFQIIVHAAGGDLANVNVTGSIAGGPQVTLYREHYVRVSGGYGSDGPNSPEGDGWYPDGLIPFKNPETGRGLSGPLKAAPFDVKMGRNQPIWVDVYIPRATAAGTYRGDFTVTAGQQTATVTVAVVVWNFALPVKPALKSCILYWPTSNGGVGRGETQPDAELLRHRLMPMSVSLANEKRFAETLGLNATNAGFWSGADMKTGAMKAAPSPAACRAAAARHRKDLLLYNYTADEIGHNAALYAGLKQWARSLHQAGIKNLVTMSPTPELYDDGTGRSAVDIWVMLPKMYDESQAQVAQVLRKGDAVWSYNALAQDGYSPKWLLHYAPIDYRIQPGFINYSLGLTGVLYWRADYWSADPWHDPSKWRGYPGEGMLVYPGAAVGLPGRVVASMRLKYLRDGVDDYDYLALLAQRGQGAQALAIARRVGQDWHTWARDPEALEAARREIGEALSGTDRPSGGERRKGRGER